MKIGISVNPHKAAAPGALERICKVLTVRGFELSLSPEAGEVAGEAGEADFWTGADLVVSLGGDGTLLETVHRMGGCPVPVAGVNIGSLGFLTTCTEEALEAFADLLREGRHRVVERAVLQVRMTEDGGAEREELALNEVALMRGATGRLVTLEARVNGELLNVYRADGLIVSTPTGSTAYSLAAGGPLIAPKAEVFVLTPICPHSLSNRSLVVEDDAVIELRPAEENREPILFTVDGRDVLRLAPQGTVEVRKGPHPLRLVRMPEHSFYDTLRKKLRWFG